MTEWILSNVVKIATTKAQEQELKTMGFVSYQSETKPETEPETETVKPTKRGQKRAAKNDI